MKYAQCIKDKETDVKWPSMQEVECIIDFNFDKEILLKYVMSPYSRRSPDSLIRKLMTSGRKIFLLALIESNGLAETGEKRMSKKLAG